MIYSVTGKVTHLEQDLAVISCGGIGYACRTTLLTVGQIKDNKEQVTLLTHLNVREDSMELFGFATQSELSCFKNLITVSGVGPKAALSILSVLNPQAFALAVATEDDKSLSLAKGIGKKTAQRIILELKDKIAKQAKLTGGIIIPNVNLSDTSNIAEAISALTVLGYTSQEAAKALNGANPELQVEELIKYALKNFAAM
ncbi:MAG: Holliday junction branch migration protein RuvA [Clostridiales bacterium]|mgnify:CR=1 FL=1|nr:Holliday junction branch migration protein RuvA [Clostridiales bacterium]